MTSKLFELIFFVGFIQFGYGIRCYICQSRSNSACQDPVKNYQLELTECIPEVMNATNRLFAKDLHDFGGLGTHFEGYPMTESPVYCKKISYNVGNERVFVRSCQMGDVGSSDSNGGSPSACRALKEQTDKIPGSHLNYCDTCNKDGCNK